MPFLAQNTFRQLKTIVQFCYIFSINERIEDTSYRPLDVLQPFGFTVFHLNDQFDNQIVDHYPIFAPLIPKFYLRITVWYHKPGSQLSVYSGFQCQVPSVCHLTLPLHKMNQSPVNEKLIKKELNVSRVSQNEQGF